MALAPVDVATARAILTLLGPGRDGIPKTLRFGAPDQRWTCGSHQDVRGPV